MSAEGGCGERNPAKGNSSVDPLAAQSKPTSKPAQLRSQFIPKTELMNMLLETGISRNAAIKGLFYTGNYNAELAAAWVFENEGKDDIDAPLTADDYSDEDTDEEFEEAEFLEPGEFTKMVFIVNMSLKMGVGKVATQVGHASVGLYRDMCAEQGKYGELLLNWEHYGETKVVLKALNVTHLEELQVKAEALGLLTHMVQDAGKTQVTSGSTTILGIMGKCNTVDRVTSHLNLL